MTTDTTDLRASFAAYVRLNIPAGTVIGDPEWWIPRLWRAAGGDVIESLQARLDAAYAAMRTDWRDLVQENDALRAKLEALEAHKAAKAAIDLELGMPEDGCNNTQATLTAIRLLHSAHRDDVGANNRLVAFLSESVRMIEGYMRAGWLTNPAAREQATDFIQRARLAYSAPPALPENK